MANASTTGFGLRAVMTVGNSPAKSGQSEFKIQTAPGVATNKGDPVNIQNTNGNNGFIQDAAFTTMDDGNTGGSAYAAVTTGGTGTGPLVGVFNGAFFIDSNGKPTFSNNVVASQATSTNYNTGSNDIDAFVITGSNQEFVIKADAALGANAAAVQAVQNSSSGYNVNNYTATSNVDGQSITTLDIGGTVAAASMWRIIRIAGDPENQDGLAAGCNVIVAMTKTASLY